MSKNQIISKNLGEVVDLFQGLAINAKTKHLLSHRGLSLWRIKDLIDGKSEQFIDSEKAPQKSIVNEDDVIVTRTGQVGLVFRGKKGVLHNNSFKVIPNEKILTKRYLYWFLRQSRIYKYLNQIASGSVQKDLNHDLFKSVRINIPLLADQNKISEIFDVIEKKITLNKKTNETLEEIAQSLFKSWFIDFDPVKAKAEGHSNRLPNAIRDLFPDSFEDSELGKIPYGWEVISLKEMLETVSDTYPIKNKEKVVFLNTGDIESGNFLNTNYSSTQGLPGQAKKSIVRGDILFSEIRPKNNRHAYVYFDANDYVVSTKLMVLRSKYRGNSLFEYFLITQKSSINYLQLLAESRSGTFPQITFSELNEIKFALPKNKHLINFFTDNYLENSFSKSQNIKRQNKNLENIRNVLLPKLISGELRISDIENKIEEVVI